MLELKNASNFINAEVHLSNISLQFKSGIVNAILGPTMSGKTPLIRLIAGLDKCAEGNIFINDNDITNQKVQKRNVAMVHQQFINYPSLSVFDNIASPLRILRIDEKVIGHKVNKVAELLKLESLLKFFPNNLSGGEQQRTAIARAIIKDADLVLMDEPLANLDYKFREEFRSELPNIMKEINAIFIYATSEVSEALFMSGNTTILSNGQAIQSGPTYDIYNNPNNIIALKIFSDPSVNELKVIKKEKYFFIGNTQLFPVKKYHKHIRDGIYSIAVRPYHGFSKKHSKDMIEFKMKILGNEFAGAENIIHTEFYGEHWKFFISNYVYDNQLDHIKIYIDTKNIFIFDIGGLPVFIPSPRV